MDGEEKYTRLQAFRFRPHEASGFCTWGLRCFQAWGHRALGINDQIVTTRTEEHHNHHCDSTNGSSCPKLLSKPMCFSCFSPTQKSQDTFAI